MTAELIAMQFNLTHYVVNANLEDLTHEDSLLQPAPGGNCLNWILGHIVTSRNGVFQALGRAPVWTGADAERYVRGSSPVAGSGDSAALGTILAAYNDHHQTMLNGIQALDPARLAEPAPFSPTGNPNETIASLIAGLAFHEAYHAGQTGVLRRLAGRGGVIS